MPQKSKPYLDGELLCLVQPGLLPPPLEILILENVVFLLESKPPAVGIRHDHNVGSSVNPAHAVLGHADVLALVVHLGVLGEGEFKPRTASCPPVSSDADLR